MDPNQPETTNTSPGANNPQPPKRVDPRSLVLPTKEIHDPLNAQRVNAGFLAAQEATATLPKAPPPPPLPFQAPPPDSVRPLETYQSDVERYVREQNVSTVTVAAAEEKRQQKAKRVMEAPPAEPKKGSGISQLASVIGGIALIFIAAGGIGFAYIRSRPYTQPATPVAPFIAIDSVTDISIVPGETRNDIMNSLQTAKGKVHLSVGLMMQLRPWLTATTSTTLLPTQTLLSMLTPNIPPALLRSIQPQSLLGIHSLDVNQPFLMFSVDSYQSGYAGMLDWEDAMQRDLSPFFTYTPPQHTVAPQSSTTPTTNQPQVIASPFVDTIVENHDARAIKNANGDIVFLWTFLDNSTVLITTNADTVGEIITRLKNAPQMVVPGQ